LTKQAAERVELFEEHDLLEKLEESKEIVTDLSLVNKLYSRFQKSLQERKGVAQNDDFDLSYVILEE